MSRSSRLLVAATLVLTGATARRVGYWDGRTLAAFAVAVLAGAWAQRAERRVHRVVALQVVMAGAMAASIVTVRRLVWLDAVLVCAVLLAPGARGRTAQLVVVSTVPLVGFMAAERLDDGVGHPTLVAWAACALGALGALAFEHPAGRFGVGSDPRPARRSRRRHARDVVVAAVAVAVLAPVLAGGLFGSGAGDGAAVGAAASADVRPATFDGYVNLADRSTLGDTPLFTVTADRADFWRSGSLDRFDGRTWTRTVDAEAANATTGTEIAASATPVAVPAGLGEEPLDGGMARDALVQQVRILAGSFTTVLGARPLSQAALPAAGLVADDGTIALRTALVAGDVYTVVSERPLATADDLRRHDPTTAPIPAAIAERYLALPDVPARVRDLARSIADDAPTTYDTVLALEAWMAAHTTYTLDLPPLADGADAVEQFLFVDRRGFCVQIGSALAVMLRSVGVPTRLTVGFVPGEQRDGPNGSSVWLVRASDYHAWVEVWFPGLGWQAFDPTADVPLAGGGDAFGRPAGATGSGTPGGRVLGVPRAVAAGVAALLAAAAVVGTAVAVGVRRRRRSPALAPRWEHEAARRIGAAGEARGRPRRDDETLIDYAGVLAEDLAEPRLPIVAELVSRAAYHPAGIDVDERAWVDAALDALPAATTTTTSRFG
jgi:transglutaminase-like putative cysteine protease